MPLPIAHGLVGAAAAAAFSETPRIRRGWRLLALGAVSAIVPDLDLILTNFLGWDRWWHRSITHSVVWAAALAGAVALLGGRRRVRWSAALGAASLSHPLLDYLVSVKSGVALLWPFTGRRFAAGVFEYPDFLVLRYYEQGDTLVVSGVKRFFTLSIYEFIAGASLLATVVVARRAFAKLRGDRGRRSAPRRV